MSNALALGLLGYIFKVNKTSMVISCLSLYATSTILFKCVKYENKGAIIKMIDMFEE